MTWRELQTTIGAAQLDKVVGGFGLEAGLDESDKTLDDELFDCMALRKIIYKLENAIGQRPRLLTNLKRITHE